MAKKLAVIGEDSFSAIGAGNFASQKLFEGLGYINTGQVVTWMEFKP